LLLSLALAGVTFVLVPSQYSSSGIAVLVQPKQTTMRTTADANPLLNFDSSLSTTALILVQSLDTPETNEQLGLPAHPGLLSGERFTVKDVGDTNVGDQIVQPFIYINAFSATPEGSAQIVARVQAYAQQELVVRQRGMRVSQQNFIRVDSVVDPTTPKPFLGLALAATGAALLLGLIVTVALALLIHQKAGQRGGSPTAAGTGDKSPHLVPLATGFATTVTTPNGTVLASSSIRHLPPSAVRKMESGTGT